MVIFKDLKTAEIPSESTLQQGKIIFDLDGKTISIDDYTTTSPTGLVRIKFYEFIGTLSSLTTTAKDTIVNAINEVVTNIGSLASLNTYVTTSIVGAINWLHIKVNNAIAQEWSSGTYTLGDIRFYQGTLYKCIVANSDTTWTASHWTSLSLSYTIKGLYNISQTQTVVCRMSAETVYGGSAYIATSFYAPTGKTITITQVDVMGSSGDFKSYISLDQYGNYVRPSTTNASLANRTIQITFTTN